MVDFGGHGALVAMMTTAGTETVLVIILVTPGCVDIIVVPPLTRVIVPVAPGRVENTVVPP